MIELLKAAEIMLINNGLEDIGDRINCLRGIFYGAIWSLDYQLEKSDNRIRGFTYFTTFSIKQDARKLLKCSDCCKGNLFEALFNSSEVIDSNFKVTDLGHLLIGLDARRSFISKNVNLPLGGTGLENVTWIGDIGGGAGTLAFQRVTNPNIRAKKVVFDSQHDYGCSVNIEGDIAGYIVGINDKEVKSISNPTSNMVYIYKGVEKFFSKTDWTNRVNYFLWMIGADLNPSTGELHNRASLLNSITDSVEGFAEIYIAIRALDKSKDKATLIKSFGYISSCAREVSEIFLDALLDLRTHPNSYKFRAVNDPEPTVVDNTTIENGIKKANDIIKKVEKLLK